MTMIFRYV